MKPGHAEFSYHQLKVCGACRRCARRPGLYSSLSETTIRLQQQHPRRGTIGAGAERYRRAISGAVQTVVTMRTSAVARARLCERCFVALRCSYNRQEVEYWLSQHGKESLQRTSVDSADLQFVAAHFVPCMG